MSAPAPCPGCDGERVQVFDVGGLDCAAEAALIERTLQKLPGVCSVRTAPIRGQATVVHTLPPGDIVEALAGVGFVAREASRTAARQSSIAPTVVAFAATGAGFLAGLASAPWAPVLYLAAIVVAGAPIARRGAARARAGSLDMNVLMSVAVLGAMAIGEWGEAATTVALFSLAQLLEVRSLERARRALGSLLELAPEQAAVIRDGVEVRVPAASVRRGETLVVRPGARLALDGIVTEGTSEVDESALTGESRPVPKDPGDEVLAGSINGSGALGVRVTRPASETTLARIVRRVEQAQASRAPSQGLVERFAAVYTPAVVALALGIGLLPPLLWHGSVHEWAYRALVLLVISCPCALVISTPVSIVSGLTAASRRGLLVKGGAHLEAAGRVRGVVLDKTGTLTQGRLRVAEVVPAAGADAVELLGRAAAIEARGHHPVGQALLDEARRRGLSPRPATGVRALPGRGVHGVCEDGTEVTVGSLRAASDLGFDAASLGGAPERLVAAGGTLVVVVETAPRRRLLGVVSLADVVRPEAAQAIAELRDLEIAVSLLSGDATAAVRAAAHAVGIEDVQAELQPDDKVRWLSAIEQRVGPVAMVGDGVNDAPALAAAHLGIAMGGRGTDAALETADVVLMADDLRGVPLLLRLGRRTRRVVAQNVAVSLGVKGAVLLLALAGYGSLWAAVAADMGASLLVIANGLRLLDDRGDGLVLPVPEEAA